MPTIETIEALLRALGWSPAVGDTSVATRAWIHSESIVVIRVPRAEWLHPTIAARIVRRARRNPYR